MIENSDTVFSNKTATVWRYGEIFFHQYHSSDIEKRRNSIYFQALQEAPRTKTWSSTQSLNSPAFQFFKCLKIKQFLLRKQNKRKLICTFSTVESSPSIRTIAGEDIDMLGATTSIFTRRTHTLIHICKDNKLHESWCCFKGAYLRE